MPAVVLPRSSRQRWDDSQEVTWVRAINHPIVTAVTFAPLPIVRPITRLTAHVGTQSWRGDQGLPAMPKASNEVTAR